MCAEHEATIRDLQQSIQSYERVLNALSKDSEKISLEYFHAKRQKNIYRTCIREIARAMEDEGAVPQYHRHVVRKHRSEWPALWRALDNAIDMLEDKDD